MSKRRDRIKYPRKMDFRMDEEMYQKIDNACRGANITHGEYMRRMLTKGRIVDKAGTITVSEIAVCNPCGS